MNKNVMVIILSVFFFNSTTECMLKSSIIRTSQSLLAARANKQMITPSTQLDTTPLSNEERNKQMSAIMAAHSADVIQRDAIEKVKYAALKTSSIAATTSSDAYNSNDSK